MRSANKKLAAVAIACWIYQQLTKLYFGGGVPFEGLHIEERLRAGLVVCLTIQRQDPVVAVSWAYVPGNEQIIKDAEQLLQRMFKVAKISHKFEPIDRT